MIIQSYINMMWNESHKQCISFFNIFFTLWAGSFNIGKISSNTKNISFLYSKDSQSLKKNSVKTLVNKETDNMKISKSTQWPDLFFLILNLYHVTKNFLI